MLKILATFGTRAEAIKFAPLIRAIEGHTALDLKVVVTAEHRQPLDQVLHLFDIEPDEDLNLGARHDEHATVLASATERLNRIVARDRPDLMLVLGDTTTTLAGAIVAYYQQIPLAHVEAGLRVIDKFSTFPEEGHRLMVSSIADLHFAPTETARRNLLAQGIPPQRVFVCGNTSIDALIWVRDKLDRMRSSGKVRLFELYAQETGERIPASVLRSIREVETGARRLVLVTESRRETFGSALQSICGALVRLADMYPNDIFVQAVDLPPSVDATVNELLHDHPNIFLLPALDYLPFVHLMRLSHFVLTDSGSIQEEAPSLGKPVLVMRRTTDRPEALEAGIVELVGTDAITITSAAKRLLDDEVTYRRMSEAANPYGDGNAAARIAARLEQYALGTLQLDLAKHAS
jgi:UDP-N-acetylglucosamine 2-epimerase (non-hydrolysing)